MKPTILINENAIAETVLVPFSVAREDLPVTVFCDGLAAGESLAVKVLTADVELDAATPDDWMALRTDAVDFELNPDNNTRRLSTPGTFALEISEAANPTRAGIY
ncbi:MAG: hypothetical protein RPU39_13705 [Candidatus Sedimenticola sp. (ex Thyasira tokunagai)]